MNEPWLDYADTEEGTEAAPWQDFEPVVEQAPAGALPIPQLPVQATLPQALAQPVQSLQPWQGGVVRSVLPGVLQPEQLVPAIRLIGGEVVPGEPGDTHPDIIREEGIPAVEIDQRGFRGPGGSFLDREAAAQATLLPTNREPGRLHSTDLIDFEQAELPPEFFPSDARIAAPRMPPSGELSTIYGGPPKALASYPETMAAVQADISESLLSRFIAPRIRPSEPRVELPSVPIAKEAGFVEAFASEAVNALKGVPEFFTSDTGIASILAGKLAPRLVSAGFSADLTHSAFQEAKQTYKDWDSMTPAQKGAATARILASTVFAGLTGYHAATGRTTLRKGAQDASRLREDARQVPPTRVEPVIREGEGRTDLEQPAPGQPGRAAPGGQPAQAKAQPEGVLLTEEGLTPEADRYVQLERQALDNPEQVVVGAEHMDEGQPFAEGQIASISRDTGKIVLNPPELNALVADMTERGFTPEGIRQKVRSVLHEEGVHHATTEAMARRWMQYSSALENAAETYLYTGEWTLEAASKKWGREFTQRDIAYEAIRRRIQRLADIPTSEVAEMLGVEKWKLQTVEVLNDIVFDLRKALGTKASQIQVRMLDRVQANLDHARVVLRANAQPVNTREQAQKIADEIGYDLSPVTQIGGANVATLPEKLVAQYKAAGMKPTWEFTDRRPDSPTRGHTFYMPEGSTRGQILDRLNEIRTTKYQLPGFQGKRPAALRQEAEGEFKFGPEAIGKTLTHREFIASGRSEMEWDEYAKEQNRLSKQRGEQRIIDAWKSIGAQGNDIANLLRSKGVAIPESIAKALQHDDTIVSTTFVNGRALGRPLASKIHKWVSEQMQSQLEGQADRARWEQLTREISQPKTAEERFAMQDKFREMEAIKNKYGGFPPPPAALRRASKGEPQPELFLPPLPKGQVVEREGFPLPSPRVVGQVADAHFADLAKAPSFERFQGELQSQFGSGITREQLYQQWQDAMFRRLVTAKGTEIDALLDKLNLRGKVATALKPGEAEPMLGRGRIPDPLEMPGAQMSLAEVEKFFAKSKWTTKSIYRQKFGPEQRRRYAAISEIADTLMQQAGPAPKKGWSRTKIGPEDITQTMVLVNPSKRMIDPETGLEDFTPPDVVTKPGWRTITPEEAADPVKVGTLAVRGARITGQKVSLSKNVLTLRRNSDGKLILVSAFMDGRRGPKVTNPEGARLEAKNIDADLLKKYTPTVLMRLREPVDRFRQVFDSQEAFDNEFQDVGIEGTPGLKTSSFTGPEAGTARAQAGLEPKGKGLPPEPEFLDLSPNFRRGLPEPTGARELETPGRTRAIGGRMPLARYPQKYPLPPGIEMLPRGAMRPLQAEVPVEIAPNLPYETLPRPSTPRPITEIGKPQPVQPGTYYRESVARKRAVRAPAALRRTKLTERERTFIEDQLSERRQRLAEAQRTVSDLEKATPSAERERSLAQANKSVKLYQQDIAELSAQLEPSGERQAFPAALRRREPLDIPAIRLPDGVLVDGRSRLGATHQSAEERARSLGYSDEDIYKSEPGYMNDEGTRFLTKDQIAEEAREEKRIRSVPSALRRSAIADEAKAVQKNVGKLFAGFATTDKVTRAVDSAGNTANNLAMQAENRVRFASAERPATIGGRMAGRWQRGNKDVLAAANVLVEAKAVRADGSIDNYKRGQIPIFRQYVAEGMRKAQDLVRTGNWAERRIGRAWIRNQENLGRELDYAEAHWNDPELRETAKRVSEAYRDQIDYERSKGFDVTKKPGYDPHRYDAALWNGDSFLFELSSYTKKIMGRRFRESQLFPSYYHASKAGPYLAVTRDAASLVGHRVRQGLNMVMQNEWKDGLKNIRLADGRPLAIEPVAGAHRRWLSPESDYSVVPGANHLAVQNDFVPLVRLLTDPSHVELFGPTRALLHLSQAIKHSILVGDFFHLGRMLYYATAVMGRKAGFKSGWTVLDIAPRDMPEAVAKGIIRQKDADWANTPVSFGRGGTITRQQLAQKFYRQMGANLGRVQDALYKDILTELTPTAGKLRRGIVRVIDPSVGRYNRFLFDRLTRGFMAEAVVREFERQSKANPGASPHALMRDIARDVNNFFGNIGQQGWFKSKTWQDAMRILWLAPQWVEGLVKKEAISAWRLTGAAKLSGLRKAPTTLGTTGRAIGQGMLFMLGVTQALNLIFRKQPTWKNEEEGHKWDAWIPGWGAESEGFWLSPLAIYNEISHDLYRLFVNKPTLADAISQIAGNKMQPVTRALMVAIMGTDPMGRKLTTTAGRYGTAAKQLVPVPITFGKALQAGGHAVAPGLVSPPPPGAVQRQAAATLGIKIEPNETAIQQVQKLADEYVQRNGLKRETGWQQQQTDQASYSKLRAALLREDYKEAKHQLRALRKNRTEQDIQKAMALWLYRGYTGVPQAEKKFWASLNDKEMKIYDKAREQKQMLLGRFRDWYWQLPD